MKIFSGLTLSAIILVSGCASNPKYVFDKTKVEKGHGVFYGKAHLFYDGKTRNEECNLNFVQQGHLYPVSLDKDGNFVGSAPKGKVELESVTCKGEGTFATKDSNYFKEGSVYFENHEGPGHTYVGNYEMRWHKGGMNPIVTVLGALVGWIAVSVDPDEFVIKKMEEPQRGIASYNPKEAKHSFLIIKATVK